MLVEFYKTTSEKNRLTKQLINKLSVNGELTDNCDLINPSILFNSLNNLNTYNYCYIPAFNRYYFVTGINVINKMLVIDLHCDVLMTYKTDILRSVATVTRSQSGNAYLTDNMVVQTNSIKRQCQKIGNGFTKNEKFIIQIGG